jgi:hypothetical protein
MWWRAMCSRVPLGVERISGLVERALMNVGSIFPDPNQQVEMGR